MSKWPEDSRVAAEFSQLTQITLISTGKQNTAELTSCFLPQESGESHLEWFPAAHLVLLESLSVTQKSITAPEDIPAFSRNYIRLEMRHQSAAILIHTRFLRIFSPRLLVYKWYWLKSNTIKRVKNVLPKVSSGIYASTRKMLLVRIGSLKIWPKQNGWIIMHESVTKIWNVSEPDS